MHIQSFQPSGCDFNTKKLMHNLKFQTSECDFNREQQWLGLPLHSPLLSI